MFKRTIVFFLLLCLCSVSVYAKNPRVEGRINMHTEYDENYAVLQTANHESNNNVQYAFLYWKSSPIDYSVYLALAYAVSDYTPGGGSTGVEVTVNNDLCCVVHADGTITDLNTDLFEIDFAFDDIINNWEKEITCEIRVGIKYGLDRDIEVGVRILDCSGNTSNLYRQVVYSPLPATQTTAKETTVKTTTSTTKAATTTSAKRTSAQTTRPVITAASKAEPTAAASVSTRETKPQTTAQTTKPRTTRTTKPQTTKAKRRKTQTTKTAKTIRAQAAFSSSASSADPVTETATTELSESSSGTTASIRSTEPETKTTAERYSVASRVRLVGSVLVAVLLTSAFFISLFAGLNAKRRKRSDPPITPQEQHEDFG